VDKKVHSDHLCEFIGHYIQYCPTNADPSFDRTRVRKTTGIPKSFLKPVSTEAADPASSASVLVTPEGNLVVAAPNEREWDRLSTIKSFADTVASIPPEAVPEELKCKLGDHLLNNAVKSPCCSSAFCDECLKKLFEQAAASATTIATISCPICKEQMAQDRVFPHEELRVKVIQFIESHNKFALPKEDQTEDAQKEQKSPVMLEKPVPPMPLPGFLHGMPPFPFFLPGFLPGLQPVRRPEERRGRERSISRSPSRSRSPKRERARERSVSRSPSRSRSPKRGRARSRSPRRRSYSRSNDR
jgi:protein MPE1